MDSFTFLKHKTLTAADKKATLQMKLKDDKHCYSLVIGEHEYITTDYIQMRVYDVKEDKFQYNVKGEMTDHVQNIYDIEDFGILRRPTSYLFTHTHKSKRNELMEKDPGSLKMLDTIKAVLNRVPHVLYWHNGAQPPKCQVNGLHLHAIVYYEGKYVNSRGHRDLCKALRKENNVHYKQTPVRYLHNMMKHLSIPPRIIASCNNLALASLQKQANALDVETVEREIGMEPIDGESDEEDQVKSGAEVLKSMLTIDVPEETPVSTQIDEGAIEVPFEFHQKAEGYVPKEVLKYKPYQYYLKYNIDDPVQLLNHLVKVENNPVEVMDFMNLTSTTQGKSNWSDVVLIRSISDSVSKPSYLHQLLEYKQQPLDNIGKPYMRVSSCAALFLDWCKDQGICPGDLLFKIYQVLGKDHPKMNTIMLQGASNAGKTYWTDALIPWLDKVGFATNSERFAYEACVEKPVILIPECTLVTLDQVEEMKKLTSGQPFKAGIKCKPGKMIYRTPVILTCNATPWSMINKEREAFQNRMYYYTNLRESKLLDKNYSANPMMFVKVFQHINNTFSADAISRITPEDEEEWEQVTYSIIEELNDLKCNNEKPLSDRLREINLVYDEDDLPKKERMYTKVLQLYTASNENEVFKAVADYMDINQLPDATDFYWNFDKYNKPFLYYKDEVLHKYDCILEEELFYLKNCINYINNFIQKIQHWHVEIVSDDEALQPMMKKALYRMKEYLMKYTKCLKIKKPKPEVIPTPVLEMKEFLDNNPQMIEEEEEEVPETMEIESEEDEQSYNADDEYMSDSDSLHSMYSIEHHRKDKKRKRQGLDYIDNQLPVQKKAKKERKVLFPMEDIKKATEAIIEDKLSDDYIKYTSYPAMKVATSKKDYKKSIPARIAITADVIGERKNAELYNEYVQGFAGPDGVGPVEPLPKINHKELNKDVHPDEDYQKVYEDLIAHNKAKQSALDRKAELNADLNTRKKNMITKLNKDHKEEECLLI